MGTRPARSARSTELPNRTLHTYVGKPRISPGHLWHPPRTRSSSSPSLLFPRLPALSSPLLVIFPFLLLVLVFILVLFFLPFLSFLVILFFLVVFFLIFL